MRKIEKQMNEAISDWVSHWSKDNTTIHNNGKSANVYLHGNHIAEITLEDKVIVNLETLRDYPTNTTRSRLRALGVKLTTVRGEIYIDGEKI
jgi:anaerobic glycerol-3-phosphate dehydrogenase